MIPWILWSFVLIKCTLPTAVYDWVMTVTGTNKSMDHFEGGKHGKK